MTKRRSLSIGRKLSLAVLATTGTALLLSGTAFVVYDVTTFRQALVRRTEVLAQLVGINSAASLAFSDASVAEEVLGALTAEPRVLAAAVYDARGNVFARYAQGAAGDGVAVPAPGVAGAFFEPNAPHLVFTHAIESGGEKVGTVVLLSDTSELDSRLMSFLGIMGGVLAASSVLGFVFARRLQDQISRPLVDLVRASEATASGDLGVTVRVESDDELGHLAGSFNDMTHRLREVVSKVQENIRSVTEVSEVIEQGSRRVSVAARKQESATEAASDSVESVVESVEKVNESVGELAAVATETSTSMVEVDASVSEVARNMDRLSQSIDASSTSVLQITNSIERVSESIERLNEVSSLTESSIHELHASVQQVGGNARHSRELSDNARSHGERGRQSVQQTIAAIGEIKTAFADLDQSVSRLADRSDAIGAIVRVIEEVAEETSLLSLNAAIIASQAGSHGKAFAVVASAVKELAERTARSTREIAVLVENVQAETGFAVQAMAAGAQRVDRGVALSREAGEALGGILESIEQSVLMVSEIGRAADAQARDLSQVDRAATQMRQSVDEVSRAIQDQKASSGDIRRGVEHIRALGQEVKRSTTEQSRATKLVTAAVERVSGMVQEILRATREQTKGSDQIRTALQVFREVTGESARTAEEMQRSVATLSNRSTQLEEGIGRFKL